MRPARGRNPGAPSVIAPAAYGGPGTDVTLRAPPGSIPRAAERCCRCRQYAAEERAGTSFSRIRSISSAAETAMSHDRKHEPASAGAISTERDNELRYWMKHLSVTRDRLLEALRQSAIRAKPCGTTSDAGPRQASARPAPLLQGAGNRAAGNRIARRPRGQVASPRATRLVPMTHAAEWHNRMSCHGEHLFLQPVARGTPGQLPFEVCLNATPSTPDDSKFCAAATSS